MCALEEANDALDDFIEEYDTCATCAFWTPELIGGICDAPEYQIGHLKEDTGTCEQHEFKDNELKKQLGVLVKKYYDAWYIVEGFLCFSPTEAEA